MTTLVETSDEEPTLAVARTIAELAWSSGGAEVFRFDLLCFCFALLCVCSTSFSFPAWLWLDNVGNFCQVYDDGVSNSLQYLQFESVESDIFQWQMACRLGFGFTSMVRF